MSESWVEGWLDDLERQAGAQALQERAQEVDDLVADAYRGVSWADRLRGSLGASLSMEIAGYGAASGSLLRVGRDWCLLRCAGVDLVVLLDAVAGVRGLGGEVVTAAAQPVWSRLGAGSMMREAAQEGRRLRFFLTEGTKEQGVPTRVGSDFVELVVEGSGGPVVVPWARVGAFALL